MSCSPYFFFIEHELSFGVRSVGSIVGPASDSEETRGGLQQVACPGVTGPREGRQVDVRQTAVAGEPGHEATTRSTGEPGVLGPAGHPKSADGPTPDQPSASPADERRHQLRLPRLGRHQHQQAAADHQRQSSPVVHVRPRGKWCSTDPGHGFPTADGRPDQAGGIPIWKEEMFVIFGSIKWVNQSDIQAEALWRRLAIPLVSSSCQYVSTAGHKTSII